MAQQVLTKGGSGVATGTLSANVVANVALVTLPTDEGYEYTVTVSGALKGVTAATRCGGMVVGGVVLPVVLSAITALDWIPFPSTGLAASVSTPAMGMAANPLSMAELANKAQTLFSFQAAPGVAITVPVYSNTLNDIYYLFYSYVGRKVMDLPN